MSQNDYSIADQDGQSFLNDLNDALQADQTNNAGTSAPSTTYPNQWWVDDTNNLLKIRNKANSAWVTVAEWDGSSWVPYRNGSALGTAATKDTGTGSAQLPTNADLRFGFRNWIINGNFTINQRGASTKAQADGVYGYDRWKGVADVGANTDTLEQVVESLPAGEYTLSWTGGGDGSLAGGTAAASPITATVTAGNTSVKVPASATEVQLERGPVETPFEHRPVGVELALCQRYYYQDTQNDANMWRGYVTSGSRYSHTTYFRTSMRVPPSITFLQTNTSNMGSVVIVQVNENTLRVDATATATTNSGWFQFALAADAEL